MLARISWGLLAAAVVAGCASRTPDMSALIEEQQRSMAAGPQRMMEKYRLIKDVTTDPDITEWHDQRQKIVMALGDRVFDKSFNRVFDSMTVALATLECKVQNMERASGYISASLPALPPQQRARLRAEALRAYADSKGYAPGLLDKAPKTSDVGQRQRVVDFDEMFDIESTIHMDQWGGVTLSLVRQGDKQTKVKLRFDKVYYPREVQEYYRIVWAAVDKQIFLDQALD